MLHVEIPAQSMNDKQIKGIDTVQLPKRAALVTHSIFMGKDSGVTVTVRSDDINSAWLPAPENHDLTDNEKLVLYYTRSLISSYRKEAMHGKNIKDDEIEKSKQNLISKGLMSKIGGITDKGRNYLSANPDIEKSARGY